MTRSSVPYRPNRRRTPTRPAVLAAVFALSLLPAGAAYRSWEGLPMQTADAYPDGDPMQYPSVREARARREAWAAAGCPPPPRAVYPKTWGNAPARVACPRCTERGAVREFTATGDPSVLVCPTCGGARRVTGAEADAFHAQRADIEKAQQKRAERLGVPVETLTMTGGAR